MGMKPDMATVAEERGRGRRPSVTMAANVLLQRRMSRMSISEYQEESSSRRPSVNFNTQVPQSTPKRRPTLAGVGRRLSMIRQLGKIGPKRQDTPEDKIELPTHPRFISLLSAEAQYAAMKAYEDLLYEKIVEHSPEYRGVFERTPSPPNNLRMLRIKDKAEDEDDVGPETADDTGYTSDSDKNKPVYVPLNTLTQRTVSAVKPKLPELSKEKRLLMSYRFQCAFDILDALNLSQGHMITSPRLQSAPVKLDPIRSFAAWNHIWSKDFQIVRAVAPQSAR